MKELGFEFFNKAEVLSKTRSTTIDVCEIDDTQEFREYLEYFGWEVTKEQDTIWFVTKTQTY